MAVGVVVHDDVVEVQITGFWDQMLCLSRGLTIPLADIVRAGPITWDEAYEGLGIRVGGGYWPNRVATGWFTVPQTKGVRQFLAVFRDRSSLLEIQTRLDKPCRLIIASPDRDRVAWWINERLPAAS